MCISGSDEDSNDDNLNGSTVSDREDPDKLSEQNNNIEQDTESENEQENEWIDDESSEESTE